MPKRSNFNIKMFKLLRPAGHLKWLKLLHKLHMPAFDYRIFIFAQSLSYFCKSA